MKKQPVLLFLFFLIAGIYNTITAQIDCNDTSIKPLPAMYVYKAVANERVVEFSSLPSSKFSVLKNENGKQDLFLIYTKAAFDKMLSQVNKENGIRVFFARYSQYEKSPLPKEIENKSLILLFATEYKDSSKPKEYFFLNGDGKDEEIYMVEKRDAEEWIIDYNINDQKVLRKGLIPNDSDNLDPYDNRGIYYDTKSIFYSSANIDGAFKAEVLYQRNKYGIDINGYKVSFSSYTSEGDELGKNRNRLLLQFDYLYGSNQILNQEKQEDFDCRDSLRGKMLNPSVNKMQTKSRSAKQKALSEPIRKTLFVLDNGQLCPTNCPK